MINFNNVDIKFILDHTLSLLSRCEMEMPFHKWIFT